MKAKREYVQEQRMRVICVLHCKNKRDQERRKVRKKKKKVIAHEGWRRAKSSMQTRDVSPSVWIDKIRKTR